MSGTILTVIGARPQFIKAAAVSRALAALGVPEKIVATGQHFDDQMAGIFFRELGIPTPSHNLNIHGGSHAHMTARMMTALDPVMGELRPKGVLLYGDTNSTLAGALVGAKLGLPIFHVEAGLRSFKRSMPEEINRVLTDHVSDLLFCPTIQAVENLSREGILAGVHHVGDVMYDLALLTALMPNESAKILDSLGIAGQDYCVATVHRQESTDSPHQLAAICNWLRQRAEECPVVMPLHPRTRMACDQAGISLAGLRVIPPLGYLDMMGLVRGAVYIFTDSGGLQKEAYFHRIPCVTLRSETEWTETVEAGWNRLWTVDSYFQPRRDIDEYGDGHSADRIAAIIATRL